MKTILLICFPVFFTATNLFASAAPEYRLPVGQGVALPSSTLHLFTDQNPIGLANTTGHQIGVAGFTQGGSSSSTTTELDYTYGGGTWGLGLNTHTKSNDSAADDSYAGFGVGFDLGSFSLGFNARTNGDSNTDETLNTTNMGLGFKLSEAHSIGLIIYSWDDATSADNNQAWSAGYSFKSSNYALVLDYSNYSSSKQTLSPGFLYFNEDFQFSVTQKLWQGDKGTGDKDVTIVALGLNFSGVHLGLYNELYADSGLSLKTTF